MLAERDALLAEIYEVFAEVDRQRGISWGEANSIDDYGSPGISAAERGWDRDRKWQDLPDDTNWDPENGWHWSFLDAIGFRYYLPAAMVFVMRKGRDTDFIFQLTAIKGDYLDYREAQWALLNLPQRLCIKHFMQYMGIVTAYRQAESDPRGWFASIPYWEKTGDETEGETPPSSPRRPKRKKMR